MVNQKTLKFFNPSIELRALDVEMDDVLILMPNNNSHRYTILDNDITAYSVIPNIGRIFTTGISSCVGIVAVNSSHGIIGLYHMSVLGGDLNTAFETLHYLMANLAHKDITTFSVDFLLFGGSPYTFEELMEDEKLIAPPNCYVDEDSRLLNRDTEDDDNEGENFDDHLSLYIENNMIYIDKYNACTKNMEYYQQELGYEHSLVKITSNNMRSSLQTNIAQQPSLF